MAHVALCDCFPTINLCLRTQFTSSFIGAGSSVSVDSSGWFNPPCRRLRKALALVGSFPLRIFLIAGVAIGYLQSR